MCTLQSKHTFFLIVLGGDQLFQTLVWVIACCERMWGKTAWEKKRLQQPQNVTKNFLALAWDGPKATEDCRFWDWPIWSIVFVRMQRQHCFCRNVLSFIWFQGKPVSYYDRAALVSVDVSVMKFVLPVPVQYRANFISSDVFSSMTTHVSDLAWPGCLGWIIPSYFLFVYKFSW